MHYLGRRAAAFASPYPISTRRCFGFCFSIRVAFVAFAALIMFGVAGAFAQATTATAPATGIGWLDQLASLWGPLCGVLVALIMFFDRLAKVIPNSTDNAILSALRKVATVLGVKVPDVQ